VPYQDHVDMVRLPVLVTPGIYRARRQFGGEFQIPDSQLDGSILRALATTSRALHVSAHVCTLLARTLRDQRPATRRKPEYPPSTHIAVIR
jgi:hypothetical protein